MKNNNTNMPELNDEFSEQETNIQYQRLSARAEYIYTFVNLFKASFHRPRDYFGYSINMVEVHMLTYIDDHPGETAANIARTTKRTRGAVSQVLSKLENNGLIYKETDEENILAKRIYTTETGKKVSNSHKWHDVNMLNMMNDTLLKEFTETEIDNFYEVLEFIARQMASTDAKKSSEHKAK